MDPDPGREAHVTHPDGSETVKVTVDMPAALVASLRSKAQDEDRSFAAELRQAVRRHLSNEGGGVTFAEAA
jgi:hypothetical protein